MTDQEREFEVWSEGYSVTCQQGQAHLIGKVKAETFREACNKLSKTLGDPSLYREEDLTYWACRLFDNETDARKCFG